MNNCSAPIHTCPPFYNKSCASSHASVLQIIHTTLTTLLSAFTMPATHIQFPHYIFFNYSPIKKCPTKSDDALLICKRHEDKLSTL